MRTQYDQEKLNEVVSSSFSVANVCRELGLKPCGGNYKTINNKIKEWNIDISHFTGQAWNQGDRFVNFGKKYKLNDILIENSPYNNTTHLKERLYKENYKKKECEECHITSWNNKEIIFELEHINGIPNDNRINNLKILCPNCHSQTSTFRNNKRSLCGETGNTQQT